MPDTAAGAPAVPKVQNILAVPNAAAAATRGNKSQLTFFGEIEPDRDRMESYLLSALNESFDPGGPYFVDQS